MAKITTNADKLARDLDRVRVESVKMYGALAQNVFDQLAIDSTGNMRILGGRTTGRKLFTKIGMTKPLGSVLTSRSGRTVASLNNKVFRGKLESIRQLNPTQIGVTMTYGSKVPYANIHDKGGVIQIASRSNLKTRATMAGYSINMPPRPFVSPAVAELPKKMQKLFDMAFNKTIGRIINVP